MTHGSNRLGAEHLGSALRGNLILFAHFPRKRFVAPEISHFLVWSTRIEMVEEEGIANGIEGGIKGVEATNKDDIRTGLQQNNDIIIME